MSPIRKMRGRRAISPTAIGLIWSGERLILFLLIFGPGFHTSPVFLRLSPAMGRILLGALYLVCPLRLLSKFCSGARPSSGSTKTMPSTSSCAKPASNPSLLLGEYVSSYLSLGICFSFLVDLFVVQRD